MRHRDGYLPRERVTNVDFRAPEASTDSAERGPLLTNLENLKRFLFVSGRLFYGKKKLPLRAGTRVILHLCVRRVRRRDSIAAFRATRPEKVKKV